MSEERSVTLRLATAHDCERVWKWANAPSVRAVSFSPDPIPWEQHMAWYNAKLDQANCVFYIAENANRVPIGQIRFDITEKEAAVSVSLAPHEVGRGYGQQIIRQASEHVLEEKALNVIHAYIKPDNIASIRAFGKAGYRQIADTQVQGQRAVHMVFTEE